MNVRNAVRRPAVIAAITVGAIALGLGGTAAADAFITGKDVKNDSLTGADIKTNSITYSDIANGTVRSTEIKNGTIELKDLSNDARKSLSKPLAAFIDAVVEKIDEMDQTDEALAEDIDDIKAAAAALTARVDDLEGTVGELADAVADFQDDVDGLATRVTALEASANVSSNWGSILRNVLGSADSQLRNGPFATNFNLNAAPPEGTGSLEINVANSTSKSAFGNEVDFTGDLVSTLGTPGFWVYTTGENNGRGANNLPNIAVEIDPDVDNGPAAVNYTTMVFVPQGAANLGSWTEYTATEGQWYFTGAAGTVTGCNLTTMCDYADALDALGAGATIHSVGISKGRDLEFHGAVDALTIGDTTYDFEARGVVVAGPAAAAKKN